jgi:hypothetical protein
MRPKQRVLTVPIVFWILVAQMLAASCARKKDILAPANLPDAPFTVDPALLGTVQVDSVLGLVFRAPVGFQPGDPERVRKIQELVRAQTKPGDPLAQDPRWIWGVPGSPGMFKIARFHEPPPEGMTAAWLDRVRAAMQAQIAPATMEEERFRVGGKVAVVRFFVRTESSVFMRAIFQGPRRSPGMIDCVLPREEFERLASAIESSLGAIAPL